MITDTPWIIVRHTYAFLPQPWKIVLCKRNPNTHVLPGIRERRSNFAIDIHSGRKWLREGTGDYDYWTHFPPLEQWCPVSVLPPVHTQCIFYLDHNQHQGIHIGQIILDATGHVNWQIHEPRSLKWIAVFSKNVGGWLLLPPNESQSQGNLLSNSFETLRL